MDLCINKRLAHALAWLLLAAVRGASGQEQSFADANCAVTPPPGWHQVELKDQPGLVAAYGAPDGTRTLLVLVDARGKSGETLNEATAAAFDQGVEKAGGGPKTSGKFVQLAGFTAYERRGTAEAKDQRLSTVALAVSTGDGLYVVEAVGTGNEVADDAEVRQSINTFRFLHPPGPPRPPPDPAYQAGYLFGRFFMVLAVLGLIVWGIVKAVSRRNPPVPAGLSGPYPFPPAGPPPPLPPAGPTTPPPPLP